MMDEVIRFEAEIGRRVKEARRDAGLTQTDLADRVAASRGSIANLEAGRHVTIQLLYRVADALAVEPRDLVPERSELGGASRRPAAVNSVIEKYLIAPESE